MLTADNDDASFVLSFRLLVISQMPPVPIIIKPMIKRIIPMPTVVKFSSATFSVFRILLLQYSLLLSLVRVWSYSGQDHTDIGMLARTQVIFKAYSEYCNSKC